jgi:hypothetical protein
MIFHSIYFSATEAILSKTEQHRPMMEHYIRCKPPSGNNFMPKPGIFARSGKILASSKVVLFITNNTGIA